MRLLYALMADHSALITWLKLTERTIAFISLAAERLTVHPHFYRDLRL
jgi:hypothetical protein